MMMNAFHPAAIIASQAASHLFAEAKTAVVNRSDADCLAPVVSKVITEADDILAAGPLSLCELELIRRVTRREVSDEKLDDFISPELAQKDPQRSLLIDFVQHLSRSGKLEENLGAIRAAGYSDEQLIAISLTISVTIFSEIFRTGLSFSDLSPTSHA